MTPDHFHHDDFTMFITPDDDALGLVCVAQHRDGRKYQTFMPLGTKRHEVLSNYLQSGRTAWRKVAG